MRRGEALARSALEGRRPRCRHPHRRPAAHHPNPQGRDIDAEGQSQRQIVLAPATVAALRQHRTVQLRERWLSVRRGPTPATSSLTKPASRTTRTATCACSSEPAPAPRPAIRLHDLRHTMATLALQAGVHPKVVQEQLGHSAINVTLDIYSHVPQAVRRESASKIATLFGGDTHPRSCPTCFRGVTAVADRTAIVRSWATARSARNEPPNRRRGAGHRGRSPPRHSREGHRLPRGDQCQACCRGKLSRLTTTRAIRLGCSKWSRSQRSI